MADRYTHAIEYLMAHPEGVERAFMDPYRNPGGSLFVHSWIGKGDFCGCLTQIKGGWVPSPSPELDEAIAADDRIPHSIDSLLKAFQEKPYETLCVYAEWQRKLDKLLNNGVPRHTTVD